MSLLSLSTIVFGSPINIQVLSATVKDQSINNAEVILQKMVKLLLQRILMFKEEPV